MKTKSLTHPPTNLIKEEYSADTCLSARYLVIGKGLFGSAAARYLAKAGESVLLVGPDEPADWRTHTGVFSSHYDAGRVVSLSAPDSILEQLDQASIAAYAEIEQESGIKFYAPTGRLSAQTQYNPVYYPYLDPSAAACTQLTNKQIESAYPYRFPTHYSVVYEEAPSGHLNPRKMVQAQVKAAKKYGARAIPELVKYLKKCGSFIEAQLGDGRSIQAEKVLITTGAFANCFNLLEQPLAVRAETLTTILCEVSAEVERQNRQLPPLNYHQPSDHVNHITLLPPVVYPDGKAYIKIALTSTADQLLPDFQALLHWFRTCCSFLHLEETQVWMSGLMPSIEILSWQIKPCVASYTPTSKPIIDQLADNQIYVALGGNAGAAHTSDAIGKLAADLMRHNRWCSDLDHEPFRIQYAADWHDWMSNPISIWQETIHE